MRTLLILAFNVAITWSMWRFFSRWNRFRCPWCGEAMNCIPSATSPTYKNYTCPKCPTVWCAGEEQQPTEDLPTVDDTANSTLDKIGEGRFTAPNFS